MYRQNNSRETALKTLHKAFSKANEFPDAIRDEIKLLDFLDKAFRDFEAREAPVFYKEDIEHVISQTNDMIVQNRTVPLVCTGSYNYQPLDGPKAKHASDNCRIVLRARVSDDAHLLHESVLLRDMAIAAGLKEINEEEPVSIRKGFFKSLSYTKDNLTVKKQILLFHVDDVPKLREVTESLRLCLEGQETSPVLDGRLHASWAHR